MKKLLFLFLITSFSLFAQFANKKLEAKFDRNIFKKIQAISADIKLSKYSISEIKINHSSKEIPIDDNGRLLVRLNIKSKDVKNKLTSIGCVIKDEGWDEIYAWVPNEKFEILAGFDEVKSVVAIPQYNTNTQKFGEGYKIHRVDTATNFFNLNGAGVKVGVISDGMNYYY